MGAEQARDGLLIDVPALMRARAAGGDAKEREARAQSLDIAEIAALAPRIATFAILCNNAYQRSQPLTLPHSWKMVVREGQGKGLAYAVYERQQEGRPVEAVVSYRGTDDAYDWLHNFGIAKIQTDEAEEVFKTISGEYRGKGITKISATGHSLGGGLALHASFKFAGVAATAFNCAPFEPPGDAAYRSNPRICVWEENEILQFVRDDKLPGKWDNTRLVKVNFAHGLPVAQHKMEPMARSLVIAAAPYDAELRALL
ncbi:MAG TPA: hypothetical protein VF876_09005 [Burkholderiales bacterium]